MPNSRDAIIARVEAQSVALNAEEQRDGPRRYKDRTLRCPRCQAQETQPVLLADWHAFRVWAHCNVCSHDWRAGGTY